jgi:FdhE protein
MIMDRAIEKNPHNRDIINAFSPILIKRNKIMERIKLEKIKSFHFDEMKFRQGVPVIRQESLFRKDDPWKDIFLEIMRSVKETFPNLQKDWERLESAVSNGTIAVDDYFRAIPETEGIVIDWAAKIQVSPATISIILRQLASIILETRVKDIAEVIKGVDWEKGYCPVCGTPPVIAQIQEKIGHRYLYCPQCAYKWRFSRVICPCCEHQAKEEGMTYFFVEGKEQESVFTCDKCKRYLITLNHVSDLNDYDLDISAISLIHLDFIMQEKGFLPMAVCEWNVFNTEEPDHREESKP